MNKKVQQNKIRGFTLVETFVAIVILTIAVIGPLSLLSKAITDGNFAKNQITAYYLAQEALELVINKRDQNLELAGGNWLEGLVDCVDNECVIDYTMNISKCALGEEGSSCAKLKQDGNTRLYSHAGTTGTNFYRTIEITDVTVKGDIATARVNARVAWIYNGRLTEPFNITSFIAKY